MAKRKRRSSSGGGGDWLSTYADMVTLLMAFFVMLFSSASVEETKWIQLVSSFTGAKESKDPAQIVVNPGDGGNISGNATGQTQSEGTALPDEQNAKDKLPENFDELYEYIKDYVEKSGQSGQIDVAKTGNNVFLRLKDNILFDPNKSNIKQQGYTVLNIVGDAVSNMKDKISLININGHTASVDNYSTRVDRTLSSNRANNVLIFLEEQKKFPPKKLVSIGFGRNYPVASNDIEEEKKKNRRVDILIMGLDSKYNILKELQGAIGGDILGEPTKEEVPKTEEAPKTENSDNK